MLQVVGLSTSLDARLGRGLVFNDEIAAQQRMHIRRNFGCASNFRSRSPR